VGILAVGLVSVVIGVWKYVKTEASKVPPVKAAEGVNLVVAASFIDSKLLRELIDALRESVEEQSRITLRLTRSQAELREATLESAETAKLQTDAILNMVRFMTRNIKNDL
jgi:hypothetical protein